MGKEHQIVNAYEIPGLGCRVSRVRAQDRTSLRGIRTDRGCRISRVRTNRFNMPTRYQVGTAGPHG